MHIASALSKLFENLPLVSSVLVFDNFLMQLKNGNLQTSQLFY